MSSDSAWPPLDPHLPPDAFRAVVDIRLRELRHSVKSNSAFSDEQRQELLFLIDVARGWRLLRRGAAWAVAVLGLVAGVAAKWDAIAGVVGKVVGK